MSFPENPGFNWLLVARIIYLYSFIIIEEEEADSKRVRWPILYTRRPVARPPPFNYVDDTTIHVICYVTLDDGFPRGFAGSALSFLALLFTLALFSYHTLQVCVLSSSAPVILFLAAMRAAAKTLLRCYLISPN